MTCLFQHRYSFPQAPGKRDRSGHFLRSGPDIQHCTNCGRERVSSIQFTDQTFDAPKLARLAEVKEL